MQCDRCGSRIDEGVHCESCWFLLLERRVKKALRPADLHKGKQVVLVGEVVQYFMDRIAHMPLDLTFVKQTAPIQQQLSELPATLTIIPWCIEDEVQSIAHLLQGKEPQALPDHIVPLFTRVPAADIVKVATKNDLHFIPPEENTLTSFLDEMEQRYPGIRYSMREGVATLNQKDVLDT